VFGLFCAAKISLFLQNHNQLLLFFSPFELAVIVVSFALVNGFIVHVSFGSFDESVNNPFSFKALGHLHP